MIFNPVSLVNVAGVPQNFATDSWQTIASVSESGRASTYYNIGDIKTVSLSGIGTMDFEIADFNHDYLFGSTSAQTAGITLITKNLLYQTYQMNSSNTNVGGFPASQLYDTLSTTIYNALPSDLRNVVKTIYKWYGTGNNTLNGEWFGSKIWIPLEYELFGSDTYAPSTEHTTGNARKYPVFTDNNSRIKNLNNGSGGASWYWAASPGASNSTHFVGVYISGAVNYDYASSSGGVAFGLCI